MRPSTPEPIGSDGQVVELYEGLPHQAFERDKFEQELATNKVKQLHGYPFYDGAMTLKIGDGRKLWDIVTDPASYDSFSGEKLCGGGFTPTTRSSGCRSRSHPLS